MNSEAILSRLKTILSHYNLTSSTFADTIDVQRSSISHLMSGRNKPSLEFILKVIDKFPDVNLYWLLNGEGNFPKKEEIEKPSPVVKETLSQVNTPSLFDEQTVEKKIIIENKNIDQEKKLIKIVLLYSDGSFEEFNK